MEVNLREQKAKPKVPSKLTEEEQHINVEDKESENMPINQIKASDEEPNKPEDNIVIQEFLQYKDEISHKIKALKDHMSNEVQSYQKKLQEQSQKFEENIMNYYFYETERLKTTYSNGSKTEKPELENFVEIVKKKIDNYIQLHEVIQSTITDHVNLLHDYLSDPMYIKDENPVNAFISKNSEKMNNADVLKKIPLEIKTLPKTYEKKSMVITSKKVDECAGLIKNNKDDYSSIQINSLTKEEFEKIFQKIPKNEGGEEVITPEAKLNELRKLKIKRCNLEEIELNQYFPNIESLKMKYCPYIYGNFNCVRYLSKIQKLVLRNLNLTTNTFEAIIDALLNNDEARNHLKYLSCANNKITKVCMIRENSRQFSELKELDFEENKIYQFAVENFAIIKNIRAINLSSNNFAFDENFISIKGAAKKVEKSNLEAQNESDKSKIKKILILISKNLFVLKGDHRQEYFEYINGILPTFDYPMKRLTFESLFNMYNKKLLSNLIISTTVQNSLRYLNFSLCSLDDKDLVNLLNKNNALINLKKLNVSFNYLSDDIFALFTQNHFEEFLINLESIDFSGNEKIQGEGSFDKIAKFIHSNSETKLAKIILFRTSFESGLLQNFIKAKAKEIKKSAEEQKGNQTPGQNAIKHQDVDPATQAIQDLVALLSKQETKAKLVFRELSRSNVPKIVKQYPELMKYFLFKSRVADDSSAK